jgi:hypothetical protein
MVTTDVSAAERSQTSHERASLGAFLDPPAVFANAIAALGLADPRRTPRMSCGGHVYCHPVALRRCHSWQAIVRDISVGGIGLLSVNGFELGRMLAVCFPRAVSQVPQPLLATMVHLSPDRRGFYRVGASWSQPLPPGQLRACVRALKCQC